MISIKICHVLSHHEPEPSFILGMKKKIGDELGLDVYRQFFKLKMWVKFRVVFFSSLHRKIRFKFHEPKVRKRDAKADNLFCSRRVTMEWCKFDKSNKFAYSN